MSNPDVSMTLDEAVSEVLVSLVGLDVTYRPEEGRYYVIVQFINQALQLIATENEWSYYSSTENVGTAHAGERFVDLRPTIRPRIMVDDAVRFAEPSGYTVAWAYFMPREALNKTPNRSQLWVAHSRTTLEFSRPFGSREDGLDILVPVMREPRMHRLPVRPEDPYGEAPPVPQETRDELVDFEWPRLVILKASSLYAQTQALMQPRVQTLEANYKDLMYALKERDTRNTDSPMMNPYYVPVEGNIFGTQWSEHIPHSRTRD